MSLKIIKSYFFSVDELPAIYELITRMKQYPDYHYSIFRSCKNVVAEKIKLCDSELIIVPISKILTDGATSFSVPNYIGINHKVLTKEEWITEAKKIMVCYNQLLELVEDKNAISIEEFTEDQFKYHTIDDLEKIYKELKDIDMNSVVGYYYAPYIPPY